MVRRIIEAVKRLGGIRVRVDIIPDGAHCIVRSNGLRGVGLPEVEISDCPSRLKDVASNLVLQVARNGRDIPESIAEGKTIGGRFMRADQPLIESLRLVRSETDPFVLRIVDLDDNKGAFPHRLIATHLCATAGASPRDRLRLLLVSIEVWPREKSASNSDLGNYEFNPHNFWSWIDLGTAFSRAGRIDDAIAHWKIAVCMWPRGGKLYATRMLARSTSSNWSSPSSDTTRDFWSGVSNDSIREWCAELAVDLQESALLDQTTHH